jgi:inositol-pentakisphosphate 2-kinase
MHRHYKLLSKQPVKSTEVDGAALNALASTHYCPLDLYSSRPNRVHRALSALWDGWVSNGRGKGNSFRVFVNGSAVDPTCVSV